MTPACVSAHAAHAHAKLNVDQCPNVQTHLLSPTGVPNDQRAIAMALTALLVVLAMGAWAGYVSMRHSSEEESAERTGLLEDVSVSGRSNGEGSHGHVTPERGHGAHERQGLLSPGTKGSHRQSMDTERRGRGDEDV